MCPISLAKCPFSHVFKITLRLNKLTLNLNPTLRLFVCTAILIEFLTDNLCKTTWEIYYLHLWKPDFALLVLLYFLCVIYIFSLLKLIIDTKNFRYDVTKLAMHMKRILKKPTMKRIVWHFVFFFKSFFFKHHEFLNRNIRCNSSQTGSPIICCPHENLTTSASAMEFDLLLHNILQNYLCIRE